MKNLSLFLAILLSSTFLHADDVKLLRSLASNGQNIIYSAPAKRLFNNIPIWKAEGEPPLSIGKALSFALLNVKKKHPDSVFELDEVEIDYSKYTRRESEKDEERCWFYKVRFKSTNPKLIITVIVLMDGSIVEPVAIK